MHLITNNSLKGIYVNGIYTLLAISGPSAKSSKKTDGSYLKYKSDCSIPSTSENKIATG